jgi:predicted  nucleic acid-binding Zn-ribbon protein
MINAQEIEQKFIGIAKELESMYADFQYSDALVNLLGELGLLNDTQKLQGFLDILTVKFQQSVYGELIGRNSSLLQYVAFLAQNPVGRCSSVQSFKISLQKNAKNLEFTDHELIIVFELMKINFGKITQDIQKEYDVVNDALTYLQNLKSSLPGVMRTSTGDQLSLFFKGKYGEYRKLKRWEREKYGEGFNPLRYLGILPEQLMILKQNLNAIKSSLHNGVVSNINSNDLAIFLCLNSPRLYGNSVRDAKEYLRYQNTATAKRYETPKKQTSIKIIYDNLTGASDLKPSFSLRNVVIASLMLAGTTAASAQTEVQEYQKSTNSTTVVAQDPDYAKGSIILDEFIEQTKKTEHRGSLNSISGRELQKHWMSNDLSNTLGKHQGFITVSVADDGSYSINIYSTSSENDFVIEYNARQSQYGLRADGHINGNKGAKEALKAIHQILGASHFIN